MKRVVVGVLVVFFLVITGCANSPVPNERFIKQSENKKSENKKGSSLKKIHQVSFGETFFELFGPNWKVVADINRVSPSALRPGMELVVPHDLELARKYYCPLPRRIERRSIKLMIDLRSQALGYYKEGELQKWYPVSSGRKGYETPTGIFRIIRKDEGYRSKTYPKPEGGASMPYALNFYQGYWIHAGDLPGYPTSHGCIRLMKQDARELFKKIKIGDPVLVTGSI